MEDKKKSNIIVLIISAVAIIGVVIFALLPNDLFSKDDVKKKREQLQVMYESSVMDVTDISYEVSSTTGVSETIVTEGYATTTEDEKSEISYINYGKFSDTFTEFVNSIDYELLDFSWYTSVPMKYSNKAEAILNASKLDGTWDCIVNFLSSSTGDYDSVLFNNLQFLRFLDSDHTACLCMIKDNSEISNNLVIVKKMDGRIYGDREVGDDFLVSSFNKNIKLQKVNDNYIMYVLYASE